MTEPFSRKNAKYFLLKDYPNFEGWDCVKVHGSDHPQLELHDEGRSPLSHHVHGHHVGVRVRRGLHIQHGFR